MKHIATVALMLNLGVAGVYAQPRPVTMTFSGTSAGSTVNLQYPNTASNEDNFTGTGTLGSFTFRDISASSSVPQPVTGCSAPTQLHFSRVAGAGVFRFDGGGNMLMVSLTQGADCIDLVAQVAHCTITFQITGGTGRFKNASGILTFTETVQPVLADALNNPVFFAATGGFTGTISGLAAGQAAQDESQ